MDVTNIILKLESAVTSTPLDQQIISKAIQLLKVGAVEYVSTYSLLPTAAQNIGKLYYVDRDGLYWGNTYGWNKIYQDSFNIAWAWGTATAGQLGDDTTVSKSSPVSVVGGFTDWCQISISRYQSIAVKSDGTAWSWGFNTSGRLGDGTTVNKSSPVLVVGGFTDWSQVSAGRFHSLGVRTNGTAWAWGQTNCGKLGDGVLVDRSSPVNVVGGFCDWSQVSAGCGHSLGVRTNGTAWAWGRGGDGRLGDGTTVNKSSPVSIIGGFCDWSQVSAGEYQSLGVRTNGTAWAWGSNACGQLGDNSTVAKSSPVSIIGGFCDWCQVSAGGSHSLGVRTNGSAWAWGAGTSGRLGDGTAVTKSSPVSVVGGFVDWCQVSAGDSHSLAVRTNGTVWSWGSNSLGKLGDGTTVTKSSPVSVIGGFTNWCQVSAGDGHSLALRIKV